MSEEKTQEEEGEEHNWVPWAHVDLLCGGMFVFASQFYDSEGAECWKCKKTVPFWVHKQWEKDGELEKRQTGESWETLPKRGCTGVFKILIVEC